MESASPSIPNERVAYKLKGYFDLATQEIDKAVRAEEWGLIDDALLHYKNAQRILLEANSTPVPSFITSRFSKFPPLFFLFINFVWFFKKGSSLKGDEVQWLLVISNSVVYNEKKYHLEFTMLIYENLKV